MSAPDANGAAHRSGLSIVMPVLDEAARITAALAAVRALPGVGEVIVVDGGSSDETVALARGAAEGRSDGVSAGADAASMVARAQSPPAPLRIVHARRGRGTQMNAGARVASGDVLLFLHADTTLPRDTAACVARALARPDVVAGAFRVRTVADRRTPAWLRPLLRLADIRSRVTRLPYGDQALFVRRDAFERAGEFPDQPLMEDVELARRLRRLGRIMTVPAAVEVSARRFVARPIRSAVAMRLFPLLYRAGVPAHVLARLYGNPR
jgi:rSAM/selenodomain-associated transferase 2